MRCRDRAADAGIAARGEPVPRSRDIARTIRNKTMTL
jgi:hypothetical protein